MDVADYAPTGTTSRFKYLKVTRPISVEPCTDLDGSTLQRRILVMIMGPTGAGKSSFIEALSGNKELGIAKDQLEGFTQSVSAFKLVNVITNRGPSGRYPIYLIDTPGFSDPNVSQLEIVQKVEKWMRDSQFTVMTHILYFIPINDIRMPGSKRRTVETFKSLTGIETARDLTIVTSMWDAIWNDKQRERAERRFNDLRDDIWRDFTGQGSQIVKFQNTQQSALSILNSALSTSSTSQFFSFEDMIDKNHRIRDTPFGGRVYEDLVSSIQGLKQRKAGLEAELEHPEMKENEELRKIVEGQAEETKRALERFEQQLDDFGPPPLDASFALGEEISPPITLVGSPQRGLSTDSNVTIQPPLPSSSRSRTPNDDSIPSGINESHNVIARTRSSSSQSTVKRTRSEVKPADPRGNLDLNASRTSPWLSTFLRDIKLLCKRALIPNHDHGSSSIRT